MTSGSRKLPPWLMGLIIAALVFAGILFAFNVLGFGDTPTFE